jgi:hypothetical protein
MNRATKSIELLDSIGDALMVRADDHAQVFGIHVRGHFRRTDHIAEQTVSCRRSACSLAPSRGDDCVDTAASASRGATRVPHSGQKFAGAPQICPQAGQASDSGVPHSLQNLAPSARVAWQFRHSIDSPPVDAVWVVEM